MEWELTHFWPICTDPFLSTNVFIWGVSHFETWKILNLDISIRIFTVGIANLFSFCECKTIDELDVENRFPIDRSEAEKYEVIHESCVFSLLFFQPNNSNPTKDPLSWDLELLWPMVSWPLAKCFISSSGIFDPRSSEHYSIQFNLFCYKMQLSHKNH